MSVRRPRIWWTVARRTSGGYLAKPVTAAKPEPVFANGWSDTFVFTREAACKQVKFLGAGFRALRIEEDPKTYGKAAAVVAAVVLLALFPIHAAAPIHMTNHPAPSIEQLVARSARMHGLPVRVALHRAWEESRFTEVSRDEYIGPMQVSAVYTPAVLCAGPAESVDLGVGILTYWWEQCGHDQVCAERAYQEGHL